MNLHSLVEEYKQIGMSQEMSDSQAERLEQILEIAESNILLNSLICEADGEIAEELNLLSEENLECYEEQRNMLRENMKNILPNKIKPQESSFVDLKYVSFGVETLIFVLAFFVCSMIFDSQEHQTFSHNGQVFLYS